MQTDKKNTMVSGIVQLFPLFRFLRVNWKIIIGGGGAGLLVGIGLLLILPPVFEATAMILMAQVPRVGNGATESVTAVSNIEEPAVLIARLKLPSTYSIMAIPACQSSDQETISPEAMVRLVSAGLPRSTNSAVVIRIRGRSKQAAEQCATGLFDMIAAQQETMVASFKQDLLNAVVELQARLAEGREELSRVEKNGKYQTSFFAKRDELIILGQQLYWLNREIQRITPARLVSPVYASPTPVSPQRSLLLAATTLAGFLLGLLVAGLRELARVNAETTGGPA